MTRREFFSIAAAEAATSQGTLAVPVTMVLDGRAKWRTERISRFWSHIWPEATRDFERGGIRIQSEQKAGSVARPEGRQPVVSGLDRGVLNLVITDRIPMEWDRGRALSGVTARYRGFHLCMVAVDRANGHQIPFLSVNTCVHELLHALLHDIFEDRPQGVFGAAREFRVDFYATRLWLFQDGARIREAAHSYLERLRGEVARV